MIIKAGKTFDLSYWNNHIVSALALKDIDFDQIVSDKLTIIDVVDQLTVDGYISLIEPKYNYSIKLAYDAHYDMQYDVVNNEE